MDYVVKFRADHSNAELTTRAIQCSDGLTRLITFENWYWRKLDFLVSLSDDSDICSITDVCISSIRTKNKARFEQLFHELFGYCIYSFYHAHRGRRKGIANDYWMPLF